MAIIAILLKKSIILIIFWPFDLSALYYRPYGAHAGGVGHSPPVRSHSTLRLSARSQEASKKRCRQGGDNIFVTVHRVAKAARERAHDPAGERRRGVQQLPEVAVGDHQQTHRCRGHDVRRAGLTVDQAHLAEEVARSQAHRAGPRGGHAGLPLDDDEQFAADIAGGRQPLPRRDLDLVGEPADLLELSL